MRRIQKILITEYREFQDTILVESSFAQVTQTGQGIRQIQLGKVIMFH